MQATLCGLVLPVIADTGADQSAMTLPLFRRLQGAPRLRPFAGKVSLFGTDGRAVGQLSLMVALRPTVHGVVLSGELLVNFLVVEGDSEAVCFGRDLWGTRPILLGFFTRQRCVGQMISTSLRASWLWGEAAMGLFHLSCRRSVAFLCRNVMDYCHIRLDLSRCWIVRVKYRSLMRCWMQLPRPQLLLVRCRRLNSWRRQFKHLARVSDQR